MKFWKIWIFHGAVYLKGNISELAYLFKKNVQRACYVSDFAPFVRLKYCLLWMWPIYINLKVLDFSYISKTKILKKKKIRFFYPTPPRRGVLKKWKFWKVVGEPKLQNMIFKAHKNKAKSKRWALYLENWASYDTFRDATWGENLYQTRFSNLKISVSFWDLGPIFCKWAQFLVRSNFYIATWGLTQLLHWFLRGADLAPPLRSTEFGPPPR